MVFKEIEKKIEIKTAAGEKRFTMSRGSFSYKDRRSKIRQAVLKEQAVTGSRKTFALETASGGKIGELFTESSGSRTEVRVQITDGLSNRVFLAFPCGAGEHFFGGGEVFTKFDLKGEKIRIWTSEHQNAKRIARKIIRTKLLGRQPQKAQPFSAYESYYVQPTFVSSRKYFFHIATDDYVEVDFRSSDTVTLLVHGSFTLIFEKAPSFEALSEKLSALLGKQPELPDWIYDGMIFGIQQGSKTIEEKLRTLDRYKIPVSGVWAQDWCGCRRTQFGYQVMWNWQADDTLYPALASAIGAWKNRGIRFLGYVNPFLALEKGLYKTAHENGWCVKNSRGEDYLVTITTFPAAMIDLTNPDAYSWYKSVIKENLLEAGMGGWMADFGEYLPTDAVLFSGEKAETAHNRWPALWAKLNREALEESGLLGEAFFFTRAGHTGSVRWSTMMWNGDQHVDFSLDDGLASVIPATLSLAVSGFGLCHSDVGGYTTVYDIRRSKELFMRWVEMSAFSLLMRSHEGNQPWRNVQFDSDEELLIHLGRFVRIHVGLKNYLKEAVKENARKGLPVIRPLFFHYDEERAFTESYEYLLGRDLLVAPVLQEKATERTVWLPQDDWLHLFTGESYQGGEHRVSSPMGRPPVFIRRDSSWKAEVLAAVKKETENKEAV